VLSGRVSHSSSGDRRVPYLRKGSMLWIWQHKKGQIITILYLELKKNRGGKGGGKGTTFKNVLSLPLI
jgi:hypothetical protein